MSQLELERVLLSKMVSYKEEHQSFMSGHTGTSFDELFLVFSAVCLLTALRDAVFLWTNFHSQRNPVKFSLMSLWPRFLIEYGIIVLPALLIMTLLSDSILLVLGSLAFVIFGLYLLHIIKYRPESMTTILHDVNLDERKTFVTNFRSIVNLITALAILAVDFQVFPRKLAKTEKFGYGMMDFGVGFFVVSNAIVSPEARGKDNVLPKLTQIKKAIVSSLPILTIGMLRLMTVKGIDYQEHVTEYGVHWNFFFTLAALKVSSTLLFCVVPHIKPGITGLLLMLGHQYCMSNGLSDYIVLGADGKGGRTTLVDANREGIFSLPGYISLYMMGVQLGRFLFIKRTNLQDWLKAVAYLFTVMFYLMFINTVINNRVQVVSRRFVNAAYVLSSMIFSFLALTICMAGDIAKTYSVSINKTASFHRVKASSKSKRPLGKDQNSPVKESSHNDEDDKLKKNRKNDDGRESCILEAIGFNSLLFFLVANLMTGFVNVSMSTIHANTPSAMAVLSVYSFSLTLLFVVLYLQNVKTKFW